MHVANALAAACAAVCLRVAPDDIARGLRTFPSSPGRVERRVVDGREIVLDYGHNIAALRSVADLAERIANGRRVIGVVSMPGDRRDEDRVAFGALAGTLFDRLYVAEPAVRGRAAGEAAALLIDGAAKPRGGRPARCGQPIFVADEAAAAQAAFAGSEPDDLLVFCVANGPRAMAMLSGSGETSGPADLSAKRVRKKPRSTPHQEGQR
jgi:cyanophycin synthetase